MCISPMCVCVCVCLYTCLSCRQFLMENARPDGTLHATDAHEILQEVWYINVHLKQVTVQGMVG